jgi:site-specific recombinase XerC
VLRWSDSELAVVSVDSFSIPALITRASPSTRKKFFEFFTVPIRNANTRAAYNRAIQQFLGWVERAGYQDLEDIEPITVAAYIETLQHQAAPPTVKQHMAAIRMLFSWLTEKGVLAMDPARGSGPLRPAQTSCGTRLLRLSHSRGPPSRWNFAP